MMGNIQHVLELGVLGQADEVATDALCFMVVAINAGWKLPIGYFLIGSLNAKGESFITN